MKSSDSDDLCSLTPPGDDNIKLSKLVTSSLTETILAVLVYLSLMLGCLNDLGDKQYFSCFFVFLFGVFCFEGRCVFLFCLTSSFKHVCLISCLVSDNIWPAWLKETIHENHYLCFCSPTFLLEMTSSCTTVSSHSLSRSFPDWVQSNKGNKKIPKTVSKNSYLRFHNLFWWHPLVRCSIVIGMWHGKRDSETNKEYIDS